MEQALCIATNTFRELVRSKVLYLTIFFAVLVVLASALFGSVTIGDQIKVIKDFGLFSISIFSAGFIVVAGANLLDKELARKTIFNILAKPVTRWQFLVGKFLGMFATVFSMHVIMGFLLLIFVNLMEGELDFTLLQAFAYGLLEQMLVCAAAIFFSAIVVTPMLSGLFTFGLFLAGRSVDYVLYFIKEGTLSGLGAGLLKGLYYLLPQLARLNVSTQVVFQDTADLTPQRLAWSFAYTLSYSLVLLLIASASFRRREFL